MSIHATTPTYAGPCIVCGRTNYPLSAGGPTICPRCDCGFTQEQAGRLAREVEELRKNLDVELDLNTHLVGRIEELRAALREIVELEGAESPAGIKARAALGDEG